MTDPFACVLAGAVTDARSEVRFLDHRGEVITLDSPPERVVTIVRSAPLLYFAIDQTAEHIAGMNHDSLQRYFTSGLYAELIPDMASIPATAARDGFVPNVEAILELNPDLIIQWTHDPDIIEPLERVGLKVVGWQCCTEQDRRDYLTLSGYATGRNDRAQMILSLEDVANAAAKKRFGSFPEEKQVSALIIDKIDDQFRVVANPSLNLSLSGVRNLAADGTSEWWRTVDAEQLLAWDPAMILIPSYVPELTPDALFEHPILSALGAVKARRVYKMPFFSRTPDAPEIHLTAEWIGTVAHGSETAAEFRQSVAETYRKIYGPELTEDQIDRVLETTQNAGSTSYQDLFQP